MDAFFYRVLPDPWEDQTEMHRFGSPSFKWEGASHKEEKGPENIPDLCLKKTLYPKRACRPW